MGRGPGGGITITIVPLPPSRGVPAHPLCLSFLVRVTFPSQSTEGLTLTPRSPHAAEGWCLLQPPHSKQPELLQVPWGYQTQLALGRQHGGVTMRLRAGVQPECHRAIFRTPFYSCCILCLLTGRTPGPTLYSPFLSFAL